MMKSTTTEKDSSPPRQVSSPGRKPDRFLKGRQLPISPDLEADENNHIDTDQQDGSKKNVQLDTDWILDLTKNNSLQSDDSFRGDKKQPPAHTPKVDPRNRKAAPTTKIAQGPPPAMNATTTTLDPEVILNLTKGSLVNTTTATTTGEQTPPLENDDEMAALKARIRNGTSSPPQSDTTKNRDTVSPTGRLQTKGRLTTTATNSLLKAAMLEEEEEEAGQQIAGNNNKSPSPRRPRSHSPQSPLCDEALKQHLKSSGYHVRRRHRSRSPMHKNTDSEDNDPSSLTTNSNNLRSRSSSPYTTDEDDAALKCRYRSVDGGNPRQQRRSRTRGNEESLEKLQSNPYNYRRSRNATVTPLRKSSTGITTPQLRLSTSGPAPPPPDNSIYPLEKISSDTLHSDPIPPPVLEEVSTSQVIIMQPGAIAIGGKEGSSTCFSYTSTPTPITSIVRVADDNEGKQGNNNNNNNITATTTATRPPPHASLQPPRHEQSTRVVAEMVDDAEPVFYAKDVQADDRDWSRRMIRMAFFVVVCVGVVLSVVLVAIFKYKSVDEQEYTGHPECHPDLLNHDETYASPKLAIRQCFCFGEIQTDLYNKLTEVERDLYRGRLDTFLVPRIADEYGLSNTTILDLKDENSSCHPLHQAMLTWALTTTDFHPSLDEESEVHDHSAHAHQDEEEEEDHSDHHHHYLRFLESSGSASHDFAMEQEEDAKIDIAAVLNTPQEVLDNLFFLIYFYILFDGLNWDDNSGWLELIDPCDWAGVSCSFVDAFSKLSLPSNGLRGNLTETRLWWKWAAPTLALLDLSRNPGIFGSLPQDLMLHDGSLDTLLLEELSLSGDLPFSLPSQNGLTRPLNPRLDILHLHSNQFAGTLPGSWFVPPPGDPLGIRLRHLELNENNLHGTIPTEIGFASHLVNLQFPDNELEGTLPTQMAQLSHLELLDLGGNSFTGTIPDFLGQLTRLDQLTLYESGLTGPIPESFCVDDVPAARNFGNTTSPIPEQPPTRLRTRRIFVACSTTPPCSCCGYRNDTANTFPVQLFCAEDVLIDAHNHDVDLLENRDSHGEEASQNEHSHNH